MKILITGISGYIAPRLASRLSDRGDSVRGADRVIPADPGAWSGGFVHGDLWESAVAARAVEGVDSIYHLAAAKHDWGISDAEFHRDNVEVTERLLETATEHGVSEFVFYSSVAAMGSVTTAKGEEDPAAPDNAYGRSKLEAERLVHDWVAEGQDRRAIVIRPSVVFGPGNPLNTNVQRVISGIDRRRFVVVGNGRTLKSTSYIENLVAATEFVADNAPKHGWHVFNYVDHPVLSTGELVRAVSAQLDVAAPRIRIPLSMVYPIGLVADALAAVLRIDIPITGARMRKFCTSTNFSAEKIRAAGFRQPVSNREAIRRTVAWHRGRFGEIEAVVGT